MIDSILFDSDWYVAILLGLCGMYSSVLGSSLKAVLCIPQRSFAVFLLNFLYALPFLLYLELS